MEEGITCRDGPMKRTETKQGSSVDYNGQPSAIFHSKRRIGHSLFSTAGQNDRPNSVCHIYQLQIVVYILFIHRSFTLLLQ